MKERKYLTAGDRDNIRLLLQNGMDLVKIADIFNVSKKTVQNIAAASRYADAKEYAPLLKTYFPISKPLQDWILSRWKLDLEEMKREVAEAEAPAAKGTEADEPAPNKTDATPACLTDIEDAVHVAAAKICDRIDLRAAEVVKAIGQLSTVIQSMTNGHIKQGNINTDLLLQEIKKQTELLAGVKNNTRPRYDNRVT